MESLCLNDGTAHQWAGGFVNSLLTKELQTGFAPDGTLRVAINYGNPILASRCAATGEPSGVSVDLAREIAKRLEINLDLITFESAGESVKAVESGRADVGFFAIDPERQKHLNFTAPYLLIEGAYAVRSASLITTLEDVDQPNNVVTVGKGSAYDLFLTRALKHAHIDRAATSPGVIDHFMQSGHQVAAGVRQQLERDVARYQNLRMVPGRFMSIQQAMAVPASRGAAVAAYLRLFVELAKGNGTVADALLRHAIEGAEVAALSSHEA